MSALRTDDGIGSLRNERENGLGARLAATRTFRGNSGLEGHLGDSELSGVAVSELSVGSPRSQPRPVVPRAGATPLPRSFGSSQTQSPLQPSSFGGRWVALAQEPIAYLGGDRDGPRSVNYGCEGGSPTNHNRLPAAIFPARGSRPDRLAPRDEGDGSGARSRSPFSDSPPRGTRRDPASGVRVEGGRLVSAYRDAGGLSTT